MSNFAKVFESDIGQILVVLDLNGEDDSPDITITISPVNFGLCSTRISFQDTDEGADAAQQVLNSMTVEMAIEAIRPLMQTLNILEAGRPNVTY